MFLRKSITCLALSAFGLTSVLASNASAMESHRAPAVHHLGLNPESAMPIYGTYEVSWKAPGGAWQKVGELGFDHFYRQRKLDLTGKVPAGAPVTLRLTQAGGGASQLDEVRFGGQNPLGLQGLQKRKLAQTDRDVIVSSGKMFEFRFPAGNDAVLTLGARVEPTKIPHFQFNLPENNKLRGPETGWSFLPYRLGSNPLRLKADGELREVAGKAPFLRENRISGTGHGFGDVYTWIGNDPHFLYAAFDFTIDNTIEDNLFPGSEDYAKVYVRNGNAMQEFKLLVTDSTWGKAGFTYTDQVGYEHRTFEFRIPLAEIKALQDDTPREEQTVSLAFGLYGSASEGHYPIRVSYAPKVQRYLVVSGYSAGMGEVPTARWLAADGSPLGAPFPLTQPTNPLANDTFSLDAVWVEEESAFLAAWKQNDGVIRGRHVYPAGTTGPVFTLATGLGTTLADISLGHGGTGSFPYLLAAVNTTTGNLMTVALAADGTTTGTTAEVPANGWARTPSLTPLADGTYFLVWHVENLTGEVYGRRIAADGSLLESTVPLSGTTGNYEIHASAAYDPERNRVLVAWRSDGGSDINATLYYPADGTVGTTFTLYDPGFDYAYPRPALGWDPVRQRYMLVAQLTNAGSVPFRYGEVDPADFTFAYGPVTTAAQALNNTGPSLVVAGDTGATLMGWQAYAPSSFVYDYAVAVTNLPEAVATPASLNFGTVAVGLTADREVVITNDGAERSLLPANMSISGAAFQLQADGCGGVLLAPGDDCSVTVRATGAATVAPGALLINGATLVTLTMTADTTVPGLVLSDPTPPATDGKLDFGHVALNAHLVRNIVVTNEGNAPLKIGAIDGSELAAPFVLDAKACNDKTLAAGASCTLQVTFSPTETGDFAAEFAIPSNDPDTASVTVQLTGLGVIVGDIPKLTAAVPVAPVDGATGVAVPVEFTFRAALASDGGAVTHTLFVCEDPNFAGCTGANTPAQAPAGMLGLLGFAALGLGIVVMRRRSVWLGVVLFATAAGACAEGAAELAATQEPVLNQTVSDLESGTKYYWKVVAVAKDGTRSDSETRSFTTK